MPIVVYLAIFWPIFWPPNPLKSPLYYQWSTFKGSYSIKSLHKLVLPEDVFNSYLNGRKSTKCVREIYIWQFWPIIECPDPLRSPLYYQGRTSVFIYSKIYWYLTFKVEMYKMCPKVVYLAILTNFLTP